MKTKLIIHIEGGLIQAVTTNIDDMEIAIVDTDNDVGDESEMHNIPGYGEAYARFEEPVLADEAEITGVYKAVERAVKKRRTARRKS